MSMLASQLAPFLDAVAAKTPTPGGGAVSAGAGALACSMARMVAVYSIGDSADADVAALADQLERVDHLLRRLADEDAVAYRALTDATRKLKADASTKGEYELAVNIAATVPMEIATVACRSLDIMTKLVPAAKKYMLTDLGVAAVLAEASARAAGYMVRANTIIMPNEDVRRQTEQALDDLLTKSAARLVDIQTALSSRL